MSLGGALEQAVRAATENSAPLVVRVSGMPLSTTEDEIRHLLLGFGKIVSLTLTPDVSGAQRIVDASFEAADDAQSAAETLNDIDYKQSHLSATLLTSQAANATRPVVSEPVDASATPPADPTACVGSVCKHRVHIQHIPLSITDVQVACLCSRFGEIISCRTLAEQDVRYPVGMTRVVEVCAADLATAAQMAHDLNAARPFQECLLQLRAYCADSEGNPITLPVSVTKALHSGSQGSSVSGSHPAGPVASKSPVPGVSVSPSASLRQKQQIVAQRIAPATPTFLRGKDSPSSNPIAVPNNISGEPLELSAHSHTSESSLHASSPTVLRQYSSSSSPKQGITLQSLSAAASARMSALNRGSHPITFPFNRTGSVGSINSDP